MDSETEYHYGAHPTSRAVSKKHVTISALVLAGVVVLGAGSLTKSPLAPSSEQLSSGKEAPAAGGVAMLQYNALIQKNEPFHLVSNFIAAFVASAIESSGTGALKWGLWVGDPGADGRMSEELISNPPSWYNQTDWWKEEHNMIMPNPVPIPAGQYKVYGDTTQGGPKLLTIDSTGSWNLEQGVTIDDVTHHPCKAFRYMGVEGSGCAADHEEKCTKDHSPVEYKVLIVQRQTPVTVNGGTLPLP